MIVLLSLQGLWRSEGACLATTTQAPARHTTTWAMPTAALASTVTHCKPIR